LGASDVITRSVSKGAAPTVVPIVAFSLALRIQFARC
jgi:hypothetical protein